MKQMISPKSIIKAVNSSKTVTEAAGRAGYRCWNYPGQSIRNRIKRVVGDAIYNELTSGTRRTTPKSRWTRLPIN
jgi:hypothetical protein